MYVLFCILSLTVVAGDRTTRRGFYDIGDEFRRAGIVPKVLPRSPTKVLKVVLTRGALTPGEFLEHDDDEYEPSVDFEADNSTWNTLMVSVVTNWDPEQKVVSRSYNTTAPTDESVEYNVWVLVNIQGNDALRAEEYYKYETPKTHRDKQIVHLELYLVFQQPGKLEFKRPWDMITSEGKVPQGIMSFVNYYNMTGPIAGNFLYRRWRRYNSLGNEY